MSLAVSLDCACAGWRGCAHQHETKSSVISARPNSRFTLLLLGSDGILTIVIFMRYHKARSDVLPAAIRGAERSNITGRTLCQDCALVPRPPAQARRRVISDWRCALAPVIMNFSAGALPSRVSHPRCHAALAAFLLEQNPDFRLLVFIFDLRPAPALRIFARRHLSFAQAEAVIAIAQH